MATTLSLEVIQAWNLVKPSFTIGSVNAMVEFKIGSETRTTKKEDKGVNPFWGETLTFKNARGATEAKFKIIHNGNGKEMGSGGVSLRSVWRNFAFEKWTDVKKNDAKVGILRIRIKAGSFGSTPPLPPRGLEQFRIGSVVTIKTTTMAGCKATVVNYTKGDSPNVMCRIGYADIEKKRSALEEKYKNITDLCEWPFKPAQLTPGRTTPSLPAVGVEILVKGLVGSAIHNGKKGKVLSHANIPDDTGIKAKLNDGTEIVLRNKNFDCVLHPIGSRIIIAGLNQHKDKNGLEGTVENYKKHADFTTYLVRLQSASGQTELKPQNALLKSAPSSAAPVVPQPVPVPQPVVPQVAPQPIPVVQPSVTSQVAASIPKPVSVPTPVAAPVQPAVTPVVSVPATPVQKTEDPLTPAAVSMSVPLPVAASVVPSKPAVPETPIVRVPSTPSIPPQTPIGGNIFSGFDQPPPAQLPSQISMPSPQMSTTDAAAQLQILQLQQQLAQTVNTATTVSSPQRPIPVVIRERPARSSPRITKSRKNVPLPIKDPKLGLEYISITAKPTDTDPVIFFAARVRKINARFGRSSIRILTVTHAHVILRDEVLAVKRSIAVKSLKEYLYARDEYTWVGLRESTFDLQLVMTIDEERLLRKVLTTLYKSIAKKDLRTSSTSFEEMKGKLELKKPAGWRIMEGDIGKFVTRRSRVEPTEGPVSGSPTRIPASIQGGSTYVDGSPVKSIASRDGLYIISDDEADDVGPPNLSQQFNSVPRRRPPPHHQAVPPPPVDYYSHPHPHYMQPAPPVPIQIQQPVQQSNELSEVKAQLEGMKQQMLLQQILAQQQITNSQMTPSAQQQQQPQQQHHQQQQLPLQPVSPPPQPKLDMNPSASEYVQRITALFDLHEPDKSKGAIQQVMEQYLGREKELYSALLDRYRPKPDSPKRPASPAAIPQQPGSPEVRPVVTRPSVGTPQQSFYKATDIAPTAKVRIDGVAKALFITARYPGDTSQRATLSLEQFVEDQYRPQVRTLDSETVDLTHETVVSALRWLSEGTRAGDLLIFAFCGASQDGSLLLPTAGDNLISQSEVNSVLLNDLQRGIRLICVFDMSPATSFLSLPNRLTVEQGAVSDLPASLSPSADVVVLSCVGGTGRQPGLFLKSVGKNLTSVPFFTNKTLLESISSDMRSVSDGVPAVPQLQSSQPCRASQKFFIHYVIDDGPRTPQHRPQDQHLPDSVRKPYIPEPSTPIVHTSTGTTGTQDSTEGGDIQELIKETFRHADTPGHPNNATAAGTVGSWLLDGSFGVNVNRESAIRYLTVAADSGDGPAIARLLSLRPQSPTVGITPSSPQQTAAANFLSLPDTEAATRIRSALASYCAAKAPHALAQVTTIVDEYRGRETALLSILLQKYPDWDWPKSDELFFGTNNMTTPIVVGGTVLIDSDLNRVRESVVNSISISWDDTMTPYSGSCGTVVAKDQAGNVKVSFSDGRTCWWSADIVTGVDAHSQQQSSQADNYIGHSTVTALEPPQSLKTERDSPAVRIILGHPIMNPVAALYSIAPLLDLEPTAIQLLPISYSDGAVLRIRVDPAVPGHDRIAREIVARCRNQSDTLSVHLGAISAEFEVDESRTEISPPRLHHTNVSAPPPALPLDSKSIPQTPTSLPRRHTTSSPLPQVLAFSGGGSSVSGIIPPRELESRQDAQDRAILDLQAQVRGMTKRSVGPSSKTRREKKKSTPRMSIQSTPTTPPASRRRPKSPGLKEGGGKLASLQKKLYGGGVGPLVVQDSEVEPMMVTRFTNLSLPPPIEKEHDEWSVMTEAEKRRELERERHRQEFAAHPSAPRPSRSISPQRPLSRQSSAAMTSTAPKALAQQKDSAAAAARQVLTILNEDTPPQAFTPQKTTPATASISTTQKNLMLLRQRESLRKFR